MNESVFITGTDTGVGKTIVSALLLRVLRLENKSVSYWKPIQTGDDSDIRTVSGLASIPINQFPDPYFQSNHPIAPLRAATLDRMEIDPTEILKHWIKLREKPSSWIVEGAGGLMVPLTKNFFIKDLIRQLEIPLVLVASTRLGTINHTCLSIESARNFGIKIIGIVLVGDNDPGLPKLLSDLTKVETIVSLPWLEKVDSNSITEIAKTGMLTPITRALVSEECA